MNKAQGEGVRSSVSDTRLWTDKTPHKTQNPET